MRTLQNKWLEPAVEAYKKYFGNTANIIIDIGTRDGDDAEYFRQNLNGTEVYAFDANPLAVEETKKRYPDFAVIERAVSDYDGTTKFSQIISADKDLAGCSSIVRIHDVAGKGTSTEIEVPVIRMDTFLKSLGITEVDVIKVDTEGFSFEVVNGLGDYIHNVKLFHLETETFKRHDGHKNNLEVKSFMESKGFDLVDLSYEWGTTIEDQVWVNLKLAGLGK
jgi:FkbM family methyltransferase